MSFQRILVALDRHDPLTEDVLNQAADLAQAQSAQVMIMHCLDAARLSALNPVPTYAPSGNLINPAYPTAGLGLYPVAAAQPIDPENIPSQRHEFEEVDQWLSQCQTQLSQRGIQAEVERCSGQVSHEICDLAKRWQADLVVVGRRGHEGLTEALMGSVSNHVMHHAPCAVLVIQ